MSLANEQSRIQGFKPRPLVDCKLGTQMVKLYEKISSDMPISERGHAFQVNKSALAQMNTEICPILDRWFVP